jgi:hypothetical protein
LEKPGQETGDVSLYPQYPILVRLIPDFGRYLRLFVELTAAATGEFDE